MTQLHLAQERQAHYAEVIESKSGFVGVAHADGRVRSIHRARWRTIGIGVDEDVTKLKVTDVHPNCRMSFAACLR